MERIIVAALGFLVAVGSQQYMPTGWWLNSGEGVLLTGATILVSSFAVGLVGSDRRTLIAFVSALVFGLGTVLFSQDGGGDLGPIVLVFSTGMAGQCAIVGAAAGTAVYRGFKVLRPYIRL